MGDQLRSLFGTIASAITNRSPVPLSRTHNPAWGERGRVSRDYVTQQETYPSVGTVFAVVNRLATTTGAVNWRMFVKSASGHPDDRTEVTSHGVLDLLRRPNPFMGQSQFVRTGQMYDDLTGECSMVVGRAPGVKYPIELWPVMPQRLYPVPDPYAFLKGWVYHSPDGTDVPLELSELLRFWDADPLDPYRGLSPVRSILTDLDADRFSKEWQRQFFLNSAQPGGIIQIDRRLDDEEFDQLRSRWQMQHRGVNKAHRVAILESGMTWANAPITHRDMQISEMSQAGERVVLTAFGMNKFTIGQIDDVNRANADAAEAFYAKYLLRPRLDDWKDLFNHQLLPLFGQDIARKYEIDYDDPVPENGEQAVAELTAKAKALRDLVSVGFEPKPLTDFFGWPELEYERPAPTPVMAPPLGQDPGQKRPPSEALLLPDIENAMRWVAVAHMDDNTCEPCRANDGKVYRNRADAYKDYPGGRGFKNCVGEEFGNSCRCVVRKRRKSE